MLRRLWNDESGMTVIDWVLIIAVFIVLAGCIWAALTSGPLPEGVILVD